MSLWISLYLPNHSLDVLFPHWPGKAPLAVVLHKEHVCALTPAAQAAGVQIGMRGRTVLGLAPSALFQNHDPIAQQKNLEKIALSLLQYTPDIAFFAPDSLVLEVSASLQLFKGPSRLSRHIELTLKDQASSIRLGMAPTALGAWILAYQTATQLRRALQKKTLKRRLDPLPLHVLPAARPYLDWLDGIGCQTLEHLQRLPRKGFQQRSDPSLVHALDAAYDGIGEYFTWFTAPDAFSMRYDTTERLEHTHAVSAIAGKLIDQLCGWLQAKHYATTALALHLHHEKGRHAQPPTCVTVTLSQACWRPKDFLTVLNEQLHPLRLNAGVIAIELSVTAIQARSEQNSSLLPEPAQWISQERRLLDLLHARMGDGHIWHARPRADYRPERANAWEPLPPCASGSANRSAATQELPILDAHIRPFWLLSTPRILATKHSRPVYKGLPLRLIHGPERIESGWWDESGHEQRDYFVAQDLHAIRYWVYRQRDTLDAHWFLHGLFG